MDHASIVKGLLDPEAYPHPVDDIVHLQTHISSILLTGDLAYKLKKPVDFGFLDFSTLELRELNCRREVDLNGRLAPDIYLGVEPVLFDGEHISIGDGGGGGEIVDWVVVMTQLDNDDLGVGVLERGDLTHAKLDALVDILVPFYERARRGPEVDAFGEIAAIKFNTDENFVQTESYVGKLVSRDRFEHIRDWTNRFFVERKELFERRIVDGRIRECHGDLHLDNIFFCNPPIVFDCIEFNDRLACGDTGIDIGFLAMDLDARGRPDLSQHFVDRFIEKSGDNDLRDLIDFYKTYRAYVRAKVAAFTSDDPGLDATEKRKNRNAARNSFGLAYRYAGGTARPPVVVFYGLMGTGKTSLAQYLREVYGWHVISTDAVRKQISGVGEATRVWVPYATGLYSPEMNELTYDESCHRAGDLLDAGLPVAIDGAFKTRSSAEPSSTWPANTEQTCASSRPCAIPPTNENASKPARHTTPTPMDGSNSWTASVASSKRQLPRWLICSSRYRPTAPVPTRARMSSPIFGNSACLHRRAEGNGPALRTSSVSREI